MFMIGGAEIAKLFLSTDLLNAFILTKIHDNYEGDTIFPLDLLQDWSCQTVKENKDFTVYKYTKRSPDMNFSNTSRFSLGIGKC